MITDLPTEPALPGMPQDPPLWAVLIHGPGEVRAKPDRESAEKDAAGINGWLDALRREGRLDPKVVRWTGAEVIPWPGLRETHAQDLARQAVDDA